jgi:hypothetical protein
MAHKTGLNWKVFDFDAEKLPYDLVALATASRKVGGKYFIRGYRCHHFAVGYVGPAHFSIEYEPKAHANKQYIKGNFLSLEAAQWAAEADHATRLRRCEAGNQLDLFENAEPLR